MYWALIISADIWGPSVSIDFRNRLFVLASIQCALDKTFNKHLNSQQIFGFKFVELVGFQRWVSFGFSVGSIDLWRLVHYFNDINKHPNIEFRTHGIR